MIYRYYQDKILKLLKPGKVLVLYGSRRVGKTTLIKKFLSTYSGKYLYATGEDINFRNILESESVTKIVSSFSAYELIVIDEAQKINNVGLGLKLIVDHIPQIKVIATGSSSFELANQVGEPLTGRKNTVTLFPLAILELIEEFGKLKAESLLEEQLIYGGYPEVTTYQSIEEKKNYLIELTSSYLYKDLLELENIRHSRKLHDLLTLLAFQIGNEVSINELSNSLDLGKGTVSRYLDLLEKAFVIKNIRGFSRNLRSEVTKTSRYYFLDNGVRNAIINNFNPLMRRDDIGALWENFVVMERLKKQEYFQIHSNNYFWRTYDRQEIDLVEERDGNLFGFEIKYKQQKVSPPSQWLQAYPKAKFKLINKDNYLDFVS